MLKTIPHPDALLRTDGCGIIKVEQDIWSLILLTKQELGAKRQTASTATLARSPLRLKR